MVLGQGQATAETAVQAVEQSYAKEETDEFVKPTVVLEKRPARGHDRRGGQRDLL